MKVIHLNKADVSGGAAIAAYRLHRSLLERKIDSCMLVDTSERSDPRIFSIRRQRFLEGFSSRVSKVLGLNYVNISSTFDITRYPLYHDTDILNFHNLHGRYFNYLAMPNFTKHKPVVFTLHDMWSFTGHCAYSFECSRWKTGCGKCPYPNTYPDIIYDNTALEWKLKRWVYNQSNLTIVTPSKWLADLAIQSLLSRFPIHHIPGGLDVDTYQPLDPQACRIALELPLNKKVLFFTAASLEQHRKGGDLLIAALQKLPNSLKSDLVLMMMGEGGEVLNAATNILTLSLGYVESDRLKAVAYSAADLFVFPTRADNLPLVLQESMACGTPMVSFAVGGVPELVRPGITGLLANPEDSTDFAAKVVEILEDDPLRQKMSDQCRAIALEEYSAELQSERYINLYHRVIDGL